MIFIEYSLRHDMLLSLKGLDSHQQQNSDNSSDEDNSSEGERNTAREDYMREDLSILR